MDENPYKAPQSDKELDPVRQRARRLVQRTLLRSGLMVLVALLLSSVLALAIICLINWTMWGEFRLTPSQP
jgi:hypothetical protein